MQLLLCCVLIRLFNAKGLLPFNSVHTKTITAEHQTTLHSVCPDGIKAYNKAPKCVTGRRLAEEVLELLI